MHVHIAQGRWLRSTTRTAGIGALWLAYAAVFTWLAFHHHERSGGGEVVSPVVTGMVLLLALPGYVLGIRELRSGLWVDSTAVMVRGMFRTLRLAPNELDGFQPGTRLSPSPLLHRKHGPPIIVGALAHGGFSKRRQAQCLQELEPLCDQLNALLQSVQSEQPARNPLRLGMRPADHVAAYRNFRTFFIAMTAVIVAICAGIAVLIHFAATSFWVLGIALVQMVGTPLVLRLVRKDFERKAEDASSSGTL